MWILSQFEKKRACRVPYVPGDDCPFRVAKLCSELRLSERMGTQQLLGGDEPLKTLHDHGTKGHRRALLGVSKHKGCPSSVHLFVSFSFLWGLLVPFPLLRGKVFSHRGIIETGYKW